MKIPAPTAPQTVTSSKMGLLVVAGGQGTRLGFDGPKGAFLVNGVSLFEKMLNAIPKEHRKAPIAIMTSPSNHTATLNFFKENDTFGLPADQIDFYTQEMLPLRDDQGNTFEESRGKIAEGPDGNGKALHNFVRSGIWKKWKGLGIEAVQCVMIDNMLAKPFKLPLKGDVTLQCILREDPNEKVGVVIEQEGKIQVKEYSELSDPDLKYPLANISHFTFSMPFIKKVSEIELPLHQAHKKAIRNGKPTMAWKSEYFIFDVLPYADDVHIIVWPREICFAPLKSPSDIPLYPTIS